MNSYNKIELIYSVQWDNGEGDGIIPTFVNYPLFGDMVSEQIRKMYAPVRIKIGSNNSIHVLGCSDPNLNVENNSIIYHLDISNGRQISKTIIPNDINNMRDFIVDQRNNCYCLIEIKEKNVPCYLLSKYSQDGKKIWDIDTNCLHEYFQPNNVCFNSEIYLNEESKLYLISTGNDKIVQIDAEKGDVIKTYNLPTSTKTVFINKQNIIQGIFYSKNKNMSGIFDFNPLSKKNREFILSKELQQILLFPFGIDDQINYYFFKIPNMFKQPAIIIMNKKGKIFNTIKIKDIIVRSTDNSIYISYPENTKFIITGYYKNGSSQQWIIPLSDEISSDNINNSRLIHIDEENKFYIFTGEKPGDPGSLLIYSNQEILEKKLTPPLKLLTFESSTAPYYYWQIDSNGNIYFPIVDSQGLKIVRINSEA